MGRTSIPPDRYWRIDLARGRLRMGANESRGVIAIASGDVGARSMLRFCMDFSPNRALLRAHFQDPADLVLDLELVRTSEWTSPGIDPPASHRMLTPNPEPLADTPDDAEGTSKDAGSDVEGSLSGAHHPVLDAESQLEYRRASAQVGLHLAAVLPRMA